MKADIAKMIPDGWGGVLWPPLGALTFLGLGGSAKPLVHHKDPSLIVVAILLSVSAYAQNLL